MKKTTTLPRYGITGMTANKEGIPDVPRGKRIGIFGGTFNPVHKAHVYVANEFVSKLGLDVLLVIPNRVAPLKEEQGVSGEHRLKMLETAFGGNDKVVISDIELRRDGVSYTCDTVAELKRLYPNDELYLLVGDDWVEGFVRWHRYRDILAAVTLVVAKRSGKDIKEPLERLAGECPRKPILLDNEIMLLSSGGLRKRLERDQLPEGVYEYIQKKGLYGN